MYKGVVAPALPTFFLQGCNVPVRKTVEVRTDRGIHRFERGSTVLVTDPGCHELSVAHPIASGTMQLFTENQKPTIGFDSGVDTNSIFGGRRVRKLILAAQMNDQAKVTEILTQKRNPLKFWHPELKVNGKDVFGQSAWLHAVALSSFDVMDCFLLESRLNVHDVDYFGRNALHLLCMRTDNIERRCAMIEHLIDAESVRPTIADERGLLPHDYAGEHGDPYSRYLLNSLRPYEQRHNISPSDIAEQGVENVDLKGGHQHEENNAEN